MRLTHHPPPVRLDTACADNDVGLAALGLPFTCADIGATVGFKGGRVTTKACGCGFPLRADCKLACCKGKTEKACQHAVVRDVQWGRPDAEVHSVSDPDGRPSASFFF